MSCFALAFHTQDKEYDEKVDIYAIGVLAFFLLSGRRPFDHPNRAEKKRMIIHDPLQFPSPTWDKISKEAKEFIEGMMKKKSGERMSASEAIKHPWIKRASQVQQERSTRVSLAPRAQHTHAHAPSTSLSVPLHRQYLALTASHLSLSLSLHQKQVHAGQDAAHELLDHEEIYKSLQAYEHADGMARLSMQVMAFATPPAKMEELRKLFQKMDEDGTRPFPFCSSIRSAVSCSSIRRNDIPKLTPLHSLSLLSWL